MTSAGVHPITCNTRPRTWNHSRGDVSDIQ